MKKTGTIRRYLWGAAVVALVALVAPTLLAQEVDEPEASDAYLTAKGRITFRVYCANCHGAKGLGDGTLAELLTVQPTNLTLLSANNDGVFPRKRVHAVVDGREKIKGHGTREMPIWGEAFQTSLMPTWKEITDEERAQQKIVEVVYFLESLQHDPEE